jgi:hypothetical protein
MYKKLQGRRHKRGEIAVHTNTHTKAEAWGTFRDFPQRLIHLGFRRQRQEAGYTVPIAWRVQWTVPETRRVEDKAFNNMYEVQLLPFANVVLFLPKKVLCTIHGNKDNSKSHGHSRTKKAKILRLALPPKNPKN